MIIGGMQPLSLIDYPDRLSAVIWTVGCNFRCPFCYNKDLVLPTKRVRTIPEEEIFKLLKKRKKVLEGVVITGGEPTLQSDLAQFVKKVKGLGYLVKLDTNGSCPSAISYLFESELIDYVSMDIKAPKDKYEVVAGVKVDMKKINSSVRLIRKKAPNYEFRTTIVPGLLDKADIVSIGRWLDGSKKYCLQQFQPRPPLVSAKIGRVKPYPKSYLEEILEEVKPHFERSEIRGV